MLQKHYIKAKLTDTLIFNYVYAIIAYYYYYYYYY